MRIFKCKNHLICFIIALRITPIDVRFCAGAQSSILIPKPWLTCISPAFTNPLNTARDRHKDVHWWKNANQTVQVEVVRYWSKCSCLVHARGEAFHAPNWDNSAEILRQIKVLNVSRNCEGGGCNSVSLLTRVTDSGVKVDRLRNDLIPGMKTSGSLASSSDFTWQFWWIANTNCATHLYVEITLPRVSVM